MRTIYHYESPVDGLVMTNSKSGCNQCISSCEVENEKTSCQVFEEKRRRGIARQGDTEVYVCTNEAIKSSRLFREKQNVLLELLPKVDATRREKQHRVTSTINLLVHNLISLNAQSIQSIYSHIPQEKFIQSNRYDLLKVIERHVSENISDTAKLIVDLLKNEKLEKTEFSSYGKLFENEPMSIRPYHAHKIVILVLNSFWGGFNEKDVSVSVGNCYEKVEVDYDALAATLVYVLDNATKYILPNTTMDILFQKSDEYVKVIFDMVSVRIEPGEEGRIFKEGYSGTNPSKINRSGNGLGLSLAKRLLELIDGNLSVRRDCDESRSTTRLGIEFENNQFILSLPHYED